MLSSHRIFEGYPFVGEKNIKENKHDFHFCPCILGRGFMDTSPEGDLFKSPLFCEVFYFALGMGIFKDTT